MKFSTKFLKRFFAPKAAPIRVESSGAETVGADLRRFSRAELEVACVTYHDTADLTGNKDHKRLIAGALEDVAAYRARMNKLARKIAPRKPKAEPAL